jgi:hypothetical protein
MKKTTMYMLFLALAAVSCKKGDTGPTGPTGPSGPGNVNYANQTVSVWNWDATNKIRYAVIAIPQLSATIANQGAVMVYEVNSGSSIALPVSFHTGTYTTSQSYIIQTGSVEIDIQNSDLSDPNPGAIAYRIVCISPARIKAQPWIKHLKYPELLDALKQ